MIILKAISLISSQALFQLSPGLLLYCDPDNSLSLSQSMLNSLHSKFCLLDFLFIPLLGCRTSTVVSLDRVHFSETLHIWMWLYLTVTQLPKDNIFCQDLKTVHHCVPRLLMVDRSVKSFFLTIDFMGQGVRFFLSGSFWYLYFMVLKCHNDIAMSWGYSHIPSGHLWSRFYLETPCHWSVDMFLFLFLNCFFSTVSCFLSNLNVTVLIVYLLIFSFLIFMSCFCCSLSGSKRIYQFHFLPFQLNW